MENKANEDKIIIPRKDIEMEIKSLNRQLFLSEKGRYRLKWLNELLTKYGRK